jgi:glucose dehydrogenase
VLQYGMGTNAQRWSPLAQVNDKNVFKLTPAWSYSFGDEKQRGQESQAIVSDGVVYVTGSYSRVFALDAKTGKRLWTYNHRLPDNIRPCCDVVNRGRRSTATRSTSAPSTRGHRPRQEHRQSGVEQEVRRPQRRLHHDRRPGADQGQDQRQGAADPRQLRR